VVIVHPVGTVKVVPAGVLAGVSASTCCTSLGGESGGVDAAAMAAGEQAPIVSIKHNNCMRIKTISTPWMTHPIRGYVPNFGTNRQTDRFELTIP
jgi:hypothetical protein